jgi:hypothetical protein
VGCRFASRVGYRTRSGNRQANRDENHGRTDGPTRWIRPN